MSRINATSSSPQAVSAAEACRIAHYVVATSPDAEISYYQSRPYKQSRKAFLAAIRLAYPHMNARRIYDLWVDCSESVTYCVRHIERNGYPF